MYTLDYWTVLLVCIAQYCNFHTKIVMSGSQRLPNAFSLNLMLHPSRDGRLLLRPPPPQASALYRSKVCTGIGISLCVNIGVLAMISIGTIQSRRRYLRSIIYILVKLKNVEHSWTYQVLKLGTSDRPEYGLISQSQNKSFLVLRLNQFVWSFQFLRHVFYVRSTSKYIKTEYLGNNIIFYL